MKKLFFNIIIEIMKKNKDIYFISAGLGWPRTDELQKLFPDRYVQTEASEQTSLDIAVGLAYAGKTVFVYTITPFFYRGWETIRTYIDHEKLNIKLIGAGRDDDYSKHDGFSHYAGDDREMFAVMKNIHPWWPENNEELEKLFPNVIKVKEPFYINLRRQ